MQNNFNWTNKRRQSTLVKLDRVLVNICWSQRFVGSDCRALPRPTSDHKPIFLDTHNAVPKSEGFRYEDYYLKEQAYKEHRAKDNTGVRCNIKHTIQYFDEVEEWQPLTEYDFCFRTICTTRNKTYVQWKQVIAKGGPK